jgi:5-(aminomethyl)-3-furanmethanol phosphate kinase
MSKSDITVVKLGGSHAGSAHLNSWLDALAACGGRVVIVPGGGAFADAVRAQQASMGFDDAAAHHMALRAMEQFGLALASRRPNFCIAASAMAIARALRKGDVPVWAPAVMALRAKDIPASWDVTSDSLAAWLAGRIGAKWLLLVKHCATAAPVSAHDLMARGVVDPAFPDFFAASGAQGFVAAPEAYAAAGEAIRTGGAPGARIDLHRKDATGLHSSAWPRSERRAGAGP